MAQMTTRLILCLALVASLTGCVIGGGRCLFLEPVNATLTGKIRFRDFPTGSGVDNVPVLALDRTAHVYAPAESHSCMPVNDIQLVGWSEFPPDIVEGAHITVHGSLFEAAAAHQYTHFLMNVVTVAPVGGPGQK
jgi:hypothetical protein